MAPHPHPRSPVPLLFGHSLARECGGAVPLGCGRYPVGQSQLGGASAPRPVLLCRDCTWIGGFCRRLRRAGAESLHHVEDRRLAAVPAGGRLRLAPGGTQVTLRWHPPEDMPVRAPPSPAAQETTSEKSGESRAWVPSAHHCVWTTSHAGGAQRQGRWALAQDAALRSPWRTSPDPGAPWVYSASLLVSPFSCLLLSQHRPGKNMFVFGNFPLVAMECDSVLYTNRLPRAALCNA
ncbi:hypothetical protein NDU88_006977 [Pleurodeles waltl]|uniref:Uncharacterized protein n=1 Tax=Pleurodeles waltl TaxID=8319 RepID=A0AAV7MHC5_PLEWA|nr:hypothetical protein NDU88_006977 [Pleurodeles waltl]